MAINLEKLYPGKLDHDFLHELLQKYTISNAQVIAGARIGEDAAVIDAGDHYLVIATDPITFATEHIGYYAVHVNVNDVVCLGAIPKYFLATLLLPEHATKSMVETIFAQVYLECSQQNIAYIGGHTEVTLGLDRPILIGQIIGEVDKDKLLHKDSICENDAIIQIKPIPIEATALLAMEKSMLLIQKFSPEFVDTCSNYLFDPGISVRAAAEAALQTGLVKALHDPTEGGLATAVYELARSANLGCVVDADAVLTLVNGKIICDVFNIDPLGAIASGALLAVVAPQHQHDFLELLQANFAVAHIGTFLPASSGYILHQKNENWKLPVFFRDEITKVL